MKKFLCALLIMCVAICFAGCGEPYNIEGDIPKLNEVGFEVTKNFTKGEDLDDVNAKIKEKLTENNIDVNLQISQFVSMEIPSATPDSPKTTCNYVAFPTELEAIAVFVAVTAEETGILNSLNGYRVARLGNTIVFTNSLDAEQAIGAEFKG